MNRLPVLLFCFVFSMGIGTIFAQKQNLNWAKIYADQLFHITEVMVTDVASPPVAARIYAYTNLAAYQTILESGGNFKQGEIPFILQVKRLEKKSFPNQT